jgi:hypothetical protein
VICDQVHMYTNQKREMLYNKTYQGHVHEVGIFIIISQIGEYFFIIIL